MMNDRHLIRIFKLNPRMYLHGFDKNGEEKARRFRDVCKRLMKFTPEQVDTALREIQSIEGNDLPRLTYVYKVHDYLLQKEKNEYLNAPVASNIKQAMKSLFS